MLQRTFEGHCGSFRSEEPRGRFWLGRCLTTMSRGAPGGKCPYSAVTAGSSTSSQVRTGVPRALLPTPGATSPAQGGQGRHPAQGSPRVHGTTWMITPRLAAMNLGLNVDYRVSSALTSSSPQSSNMSFFFFASCIGSMKSSELRVTQISGNLKKL